MKLEELIKKYLYVKLCFNRSFSHLSVVFQVMNFLVLLSVWIKLYIGKTSPAIIAILGAIIVILLLTVGHVDLKLGILKRETTLVNQNNPEMQKLLERSQK